MLVTKAYTRVLSCEKTDFMPVAVKTSNLHIYPTVHRPKSANFTKANKSLYKQFQRRLLIYSLLEGISSGPDWTIGTLSFESIDERCDCRRCNSSNRSFIDV